MAAFMFEGLASCLFLFGCSIGVVALVGMGAFGSSFLCISIVQMVVLQRLINAAGFVGLYPWCS